MTNNEEHENQIFHPRQAAVQAVHLVGEILEEACNIANTAAASNDPWRYISCLKKIKNQHEAYNENLTFVISKDNKSNKLESPIVTSTPQKGQGDQEFETSHDMVKSTSMFITQLFDLSDLEGTDEPDLVEDKGSNLSLIEDIVQIIDTCLNVTVSKVFASENNVDDGRESSEGNTDYTSYSYLSDAMKLNETNDFNYYMDENNDKAITTKADFNVEHGCAIEKGIDENKYIKDCAIEKRTDENNYLKDLCSYENAYSSLNRDYEQYLDIEPTLQDTKKLSLHEIDLWPEQAVKETLVQKSIELPTTSKESTSAGSRRNTLLRRCRIQGRIFLARFRTWWWRRRSIRKYKINRVPGSERSMCPLSPDARRRSSSLIDHRFMETSSHPSMWKFSTISEAFARSSLWKEISSKVIKDNY